MKRICHRLRGPGNAARRPGAPAGGGAGRPSRPLPGLRSGPGAWLLVALAAGLLPGASGAQELGKDVPFVTTPMPVVERMLELARPTPSDSLYDLGAGDGRINIAAAVEYGTPGVGIEIDASLVERARENARESEVEELVAFREQDLFEADLRPATIVTLYLLWGVNYRLRPKLFRELRPGTRVVSHQFDMGQWEPDSVVHVDLPDATVYLWIVPADVAGAWEVTLPDGRVERLVLEQKFQELQLRGGVSPSGTRFEEPWIRGDSVALTVVGREGEGRLRLRGAVSGDRIQGTSERGPWRARRTGGRGQPMHLWNPDALPDTVPGGGGG